jgi:hypothetical protein
VFPQRPDGKGRGLESRFKGNCHARGQRLRSSAPSEIEALEGRVHLACTSGIRFGGPNVEVQASAFLASSSDFDGDCIDNYTETILLNQFSPRIALNDADDAIPIRVSDFLARSELIRKFKHLDTRPGHGGIVVEDNLILPRPVPLSMAPPSFRDQRPNDYDDYYALRQVYPVDPVLDQSVRAAARANARWYGRVSHPTEFLPGVYTVQYYALLWYNIVNTFNGDGNHQGDLICIDFTIDDRDPGNPKILEAIYHNHGRQLFVEPEALRFVDQTHPMVFLEEGTNETWPNPGGPAYLGWPTLGVLTNDVSEHKADDEVFVEPGDFFRGHEGTDQWFTPAVVNIGEYDTVNKGIVDNRPIGVDQLEARWMLEFSGRWGGDDYQPEIVFAGDVGPRVDSPNAVRFNRTMWNRQFQYGDLNAVLDPAAPVELADGTIIVQGTTGDDTIEVSGGGDLIVRVNGIQRAALPSTFRKNLVLRGRWGDDLFIFHGSTRAHVSFEGGIGADRFIIEADADDETFMTVGRSFEVDVQLLTPLDGTDLTISSDSFDTVAALRGLGGNDIFVFNGSSRLHVMFDGGAGTDRFFVEAGSGDEGFEVYSAGLDVDIKLLTALDGTDLTTTGDPTDTVTLDGLNGNDNFVFRGTSRARIVFDGGNGTDNYFVEASYDDETFVLHGAGSNIEVQLLTPLDGTNLATIVDLYDTMILEGLGGNDLFVFDALPAIKTRLEGGPGTDKVVISAVVSTGIILGADDNLFAGSSQIIRDSVETVDVTKNSLVFHSTSFARLADLASLTAAIASARANGRWSGPGITSSEAAANRGATLGILLNDSGDGTPIYQTFAAQAVGPNDILIKFTYNGDATLDGFLNADDFALIDAGFVTHSSGFRHGDFDYSGTIDADDYFLIDRTFSDQASPLSSANTSKPPASTELMRGKKVRTHLRRQRHHRHQEMKWGRQLVPRPTLDKTKFL